MDEVGMIPQRPLPSVDEHARPFWEAARARTLLLAKCDDCGAFSYPPELSCASCGSSQRSWVEASGRASLWSWTVCHPPMLPWFARDGTWLVSVVELEEGPRMVTTLREVAEEDVQIGLELVADFEDIDDDITLVVFRSA
jgi:uncharacterized OB-fold protein